MLKEEEVYHRQQTLVHLIWTLQRKDNASLKLLVEVVSKQPRNTD